MGTDVIQVFLGTPHQACSEVELNDQLYSLIHLPGPPIVDHPLQKLGMLLDQTQKINQDFAASRLLERVSVLNVFPKSPSEDASSSSQSPFSRHTLSLIQSWGDGHSYESSVGHSDLVRGDSQEHWRDWVVSRLGTPPPSCQSFPPKFEFSFPNSPLRNQFLGYSITHCPCKSVFSPRLRLHDFGAKGPRGAETLR